MKKKIVYLIGACFIAAATTINFQIEEQKLGMDLSLKGMVIMTQAQAEEPHEQGYGIYKAYVCPNPEYYWARCNPGDGNCTFDMQHECYIY